VIVAHDGAAWLPRVMDALTKQTRPVQRVVAVDAGSTDRSGSMLAQAFGRSAVFGMDRTTGYGVAVAKALRHRSANAHVPLSGTSREDRTEWVWLLHDDSEAAPDALQRLLAGAHEVPQAAVFGPKIRDWSDRDILLEVGTTIDRVGRRVTGIEPREVDQGQHDGDRDVVAVSSAGMLVRRDVWDEVGGFDPGMRLFREDTDFCWRVQAAGYRVRVVTSAVVYHVEATARNRRDDASAAPRRRRQDRRNALLVLAGNLPRRPMLSALAGNLVLSAVRAMFFLLAKRPAAALDELAAYTSVAFHPLRLMSVRRLRARGRQQAFSRMAADLPPGRSFRMLAEYTTSTLSKTLPAEAVGSHHATDDPSDDDSMLVDTGLAQRLLTSPGVLLFLTLTVVALVAERSLLGSTPLGGGALVPAWGGASDLWQEYVQGFHPVGIGTTASAPPYVAVLAALATVLGGKPWLAVDVILLGCVPLAGASAFFASRRVTSYVPARVIGALAYALLPVGMGAVAAGRLGTAVLLVLLPPIAVLAGRVYTAPRRQARRAAWAAGLLIAIVTAFVPLFWLITAVVVAVGLALRYRRSRALDSLIVLAVPLLVLLPWSFDILTHPGRLFLEAGLARPGLAAAGLPPRSLLLLSPGGPGLPPFWVTAGLVLAATVAVVVSGRRGLVLAGWAMGVIGLVVAAAVSRVAVTGADQAAPVRAWPGPALAVAAAGLLLAVVAAGDQAPGLLRAGRWRRPAGLAVLALGVVACTAPVLAAAYWVTSGVVGPVRPTAGTLLPEFVSVSSQTGQRLRTLVLQSGPHGSVTYLVLRDTNPLIGAPELALPPAAQRALGKTVATLTAPAGGAVADQGRALAGFGIGYVLLPAPVNPELAEVLDGVPGLRPVSATSSFQLWRVIDTTARVTVTEPGGTVVPVASGPVSVTRARVPAAGGTLMLAEPAGGWSASVNGHPLTPLAAPVNGWAQGFRLPPGGGMLSVRHSDIGRMVVLGLTGIAVLVVIGLGLPGSRAAAEAAREQEAAAEAAREQEAAAAEDDELATPGRRRAGRGRDAEDDELAAPGRRRAGRGRDAEERPLRRRLLRRRKPEPDMPDTEVPDTEVPDSEVPDSEVPRPAVPAGSFTQRVAAVPAGVRGGWPRRGGTSGAEEPHPDDAAPSVVRSHPDSDSYPSGPDRSGAPGPERPVPVGRRRRAGPADLSGEAVSSRAPNGGATGRHSHRAGPDPLAGPGPATDPERPRQDYGVGSDHDTPGHGHDPAGPGDDAELPRRSHDPAPRGPRFGPRRARRESPPAGPGDYPGGRRAPGRRAAPAPAADAGTGSDGDTHAEHEERERFSLPTRFGRGGRGSPQAPPSQGERPDPAPSQRRGARDGRPAAADGQDTGGYPSGSYDIGNYDIGSSGAGGSRRGSQDSGEFAGSSDSGGYPADGYDADGRGNGSYTSGDHDSGYPAGGYDAGGRGSGGYDAGGRESGSDPAGGDDPGQAPGRERRRVRRPSHARATRPGTPPPGGGGQGPQPNGGQADDDAALSPLPPLPPRTPRRGQWDEPGPRGRDRTAHDDQGDADW
jgi:GT2 family glycosyltransferase